MASPSFDDVWQYARRVQRVSQEAYQACMSALKLIDIENLEDIELLKQVIVGIVDKYGLASGELGAQWFEYCKSMKFSSGYTAITGQVSRYGVRSDVDSVMRKFNTGEIPIEVVPQRLAGVVVDQTKKVARDTILENINGEYLEAVRTGRKDIEKSCGYARVPVGETCAFCIMLASRGFVYSSERDALTTKWGNKYHRDCDCVAVPFSKASSIGGYGVQLGEYENMYRDADNLRRSGDMPDELRQRISDARKEHAEKYADGLTHDRWSTLNEDLIIMRYQNPGMH